MSPGEVGDVNKVADGATVRRRPIPDEDGDRFPLSSTNSGLRINGRTPAGALKAISRRFPRFP